MDRQRATLVERIVARLTPVAPAERRAMREGPSDAETHGRLAAALPALHEIETGGQPSREGAEETLSVVAWNVERLRHAEAIAGTLAQAAPDVVLLSEVDKGMARSGNGHPLAGLAARLGHAYAFGVEFVELSGGDEAERAAGGGAPDVDGFHGNAVTSALPLRRPFLVRLTGEGGWFGPERGQPRVGGRMALGGQVRLGGRPVTVVSVHLENRADPAGRTAQTEILLDAIDAYDPVAPVLVGGDFNTLTASHEERHDDPRAWAARLAAEPGRLIQVEPHEPLFAAFAGRGYDWRAANRLDLATQRRLAPDEGAPIGRIDWFFTRGLRAGGPAVIAAVLADGTPSSDHEAIAVRVRLADETSEETR
jgi:endonuclease/exonuclease/phosphatase family metal-dependent hydrolase